MTDAPAHARASAPPAVRNVEFLDMKAPGAELRADLDAAWARVTARGWFILGDELAAFEAEFARHCGVKHAVGVGNGLDALVLALRAFGVGPGDEVVVPAHTFIATWLAVSATGATPVPADVDESTMNLSPAAFERAITPRTKAVIPVHCCGAPADMPAICAIAARSGIRVLEDAAQAHGATWRTPQGPRRAGSLGDAAGFSFYPSKNLGALGDGGCVTTDDDAVADRVRLLRNYGARSKYEHELLGANSRLDELQAAMLRAKLPHLDAWNARRAAIAARYLDGLRGAPDLLLPEVAAGGGPVWHLFAVRHPRRDALREHLARHGVASLVHYPHPVHLTPAYAALGFGAGAFPAAERIASTVLSLPIGPHLSAADADHVVRAVHSFCAER